MPIKTPCVTCQTPDDKIPAGSKLPNRKCLIRQCVDQTGVTNCAYCSCFPCDSLKETAGLWNRKTIEKRSGQPISDEEYHTFVEPFEGINRLNHIRSILKPEEITEPAKVSTKPGERVDFPENLPFSEEDISSFKAVYWLITSTQDSTLGMQDADTFSQRHKLENRRAHVLRCLWILGRFGEFRKEKKACLEIDAGTFLANRESEKTLAIWTFLKDTVFAALSKFGVECELVALKGVAERELTTGTGYLRSQGWIIRMSFGENIGGSAALEALQTWAQKIDQKHGKKAFKHFQDVDFQVLAANQARASAWAKTKNTTAEVKQDSKEIIG